MAFTPTTTTVASAAGILKTLWIDEIAAQYAESKVAQGLFQNNTARLQPGATVVRIPVVKNFASGMSTVSETNQHRTDSEAAQLAYNALTLDSFKEKTVQFSGPWESVYGDLHRAAITKKLAQVAIDNYETALLAATATASGQTAISLVGDLWDDTTFPNRTVIKQLSTGLKNFKVKNIPEDGRFWIFDPLLYQRMYALFESGDFSKDVYPWVTGRVPSLLGYPIFQTNRLPSTTYSSATVTINLLCHTDAMSEIDKGFDLLMSPRSSHNNLNEVTLEHYYGIDSLPDDGTTNYGIQKYYVTA